MTTTNNKKINTALLNHFKERRDKRNATPKKYKTEPLQINVEVKEIISLSYGNKESSDIGLLLNDWDDIEYYLQIDPAELLSWFSPDTIKVMKEKAYNNLKVKLGDE